MVIPPAAVSLIYGFIAFITFFSQFIVGLWCTVDLLGKVGEFGKWLLRCFMWGFILSVLLGLIVLYRVQVEQTVEVALAAVPVFLSAFNNATASWRYQ